MGQWSQCSQMMSLFLLGGGGDCGGGVVTTSSVGSGVGACVGAGASCCVFSALVVGSVAGAVFVGASFFVLGLLWIGLLLPPGPVL